MNEPTHPYGVPARGITGADVERAADALLRAGERPTIEKVRATLGTGSPNTINPLLDAWWKRLAGRLDSGPAALRRLPESVVHVAEALWMQALDEGRRRATQELNLDAQTLTQNQQALEIRSHVLTLREGELESRLRDRELTQTALESQVLELTLLLRQEQATREAQSRHISALEEKLATRASMPARRPDRPPATGPQALPPLKAKGGPKRAVILLRSAHQRSGKSPRQKNPRPGARPFVALR